MSSDPVYFIKAVENSVTFDGSIAELVNGIAEEMEARLTDKAAIADMAQRIRESKDRIIDAILTNIAVLNPPDGATSDVVVKDPPEPVEGFIESVAWIMERAPSLSKRGAEMLVMREGVTRVLAEKAKPPQPFISEGNRNNPVKMPQLESVAAEKETAT